MALKDILEKNVPVKSVLIAAFAALVPVGIAHVVHSRREAKNDAARQVCARDSAWLGRQVKAEEQMTEGMTRAFNVCTASLTDEALQIADLQQKLKQPAVEPAQIPVLGFGVSPTAITVNETQGVCDKLLEQNTALRKENNRLRGQIAGPTVSKIKLLNRRLKIDLNTP